MMRVEVSTEDKLLWLELENIWQPAEEELVPIEL
jgi:hypothetical protein